MNIYAPTSGGPWPLIVLLPGGPTSPGFMGEIDGLALSLAGAGAVAIETMWRQGPAYGGGYPTTFADIACAIGVARKIGPDYGAAPDRLTLLGYSLGGWAAPVVALTPTPFTRAPRSCNPTAGSLRPDAVVNVAGSVGWSTQSHAAAWITAFVGGDRKAVPDSWASVDPFALLKRYPARAGAVPFVLIQGGADTVVLPRVARVFHGALRAAGYNSRLLEVPGAGHSSVCGRKEVIDPIISVATGD